MLKVIPTVFLLYFLTLSLCISKTSLTSMAEYGSQPVPSAKWTGSKLLIPGPVPVPPEVLNELSKQPESHTSPLFRKKFARALTNLRRMTGADETTQPFILAGSGGLGWDLISSSFLSKNPEHFEGDGSSEKMKEGQGWRKRALVLNTGFFSDRMVRALVGYGWEVDQIKLELRDAITDLTGEELNRQLNSLMKTNPKRLESTMEKKEEDTKDSAGIAATQGRYYSMVCLTHVDTSTAIRNDIAFVSRWINETFGMVNRPLLMVDGVCATAAERMLFSEWSVDILFTASQKAVSLPPGLCLMVLSEKAMSLMQESRGQMVSSEEYIPHGFYTDLNDWAQIMIQYTKDQPCYYSTPATGLISALDVGLQMMLNYSENDEDASKAMELVFLRHELLASAFRRAISGGLELELTAKPKLLSDSKDISIGRANTLTGVLLPEIVGSASEFVRYCDEQYGFSFSGGLGGPPAIRIGHMGYAAMSSVLFAECVDCLENALKHFGVQYSPNAPPVRSLFYDYLYSEIENITIPGVSFETLFPLDFANNENGDDIGGSMNNDNSNIERESITSQFMNTNMIPLLVLGAALALKVFMQNRKEKESSNKAD